MNRTLGGEGTHGLVYTEEMRLARTGENSHWWGRKHEKGWYDKVLPYLLLANCKPIVQLDKKTFDMINAYSSVSEAARRMNCSITAICNCLNHKTKTSCGYVWRYANEPF